MDTFSAIKSRRAVKHYDPEHRMTPEEIEQLLSLAILSPTGELLGRISLGQVTNMTLDSSSSYLYITTPNRLLRIEVGGP